MILERVVCLAVGYAFGLIQTGYIVGKINHVDIRKQGSGNAGSTNAVRVMGWKAGAATFAGDVLKCVVAVLLMRYIYQDGACAPLLGIYTDKIKIIIAVRAKYGFYFISFVFAKKTMDNKNTS